MGEIFSPFFEVLACVDKILNISSEGQSFGGQIFETLFTTELESSLKDGAPRVLRVSSG